MTSRPDCYACQYRAGVPGDAHSECRSPAATLGRALIFSIEAHAAPADGNTPVVVDFENYEVPALTIGFDGAAVRAGLATWPLNFDPTWIRVCSEWAPQPKSEVADAGE